jgi:hypothetical protein
MGHSFGDGVIVAALAAALVAYLYFQHVERRRRLEIVHQERLAAMDKGIPLPEFPLDPPKVQKGPDPRATLVHGIVWTTLGIGSMAALALIGSSGPTFWPLPLPLAFMGIGLILYYALASERSR